MLQRKKSEECGAGYAFAGYESTDDSTFLMRMVVGFWDDRAWSV
jgi:hypothetical protein